MKEHVLILDTETTGLDDEVDEVIQVCIRHGLAHDADTALWNIRPTQPIPEEASRTHGITDDQTLTWPSFGQAADDIRRHLERGDVICGYNPDFDIAMLRSEFRRAGAEVKWPPVVVCAKRLWDINEPRPSRDLQAAYRRFVDPEGFEGAHGALADTVATSKVIAAQVAAWAGDPSTGEMSKPWYALDPERATWWGPSRHAVWRDGDLIVNFGRHKDSRWALMDNGFQNWILNKDFPAHIRALAQQVIRRRASYKDRLDPRLLVDINTWALEAARQRGWL